MEDAVVDNDDKEKARTKIDEGFHEMGGPSRNRLNNGIHGKMGPGFDGDACPQEGHEDTDVTPKFFKPGKIIMESVTKDDLDERENDNHKESIG